jgi:hypothetical protein
MITVGLLAMNWWCGLEWVVFSSLKEQRRAPHPLSDSQWEDTSRQGAWLRVLVVGEAGSSEGSRRLGFSAPHLRMAVRTRSESQPLNDRGVSGYEERDT